MTNAPQQLSASLDNYVNPVFPGSFPDPFVLKFCGEYYAYSTGRAADGNIFEVLRSSDLVNWVPAGGAMLPLDEPHPFYWAPEVFYDNGRFYLYYSVGNETLMELRVAVSDRPDRSFIDSGNRLTNEEFAIDAHVFVDTDGSKYLFYATDFLEHTHIGTGTVVDRLVDWFTLEGNPKVVTRAKYDWQVYDPKRAEKGGVRWHTVEGPAVLKRKGVYYEMFSGGNWQNTTYGVSFARSRNILSSEEWEQFADGETALPILRTLPGLVVGPGHNSVVRGPNNRELYSVYHHWVNERRVMSIDRTDFSGDKIFVVGATTTPQPAPYQPTISSDTLYAWPSAGEWSFDGNAVRSGRGSSTLIQSVPASFLLEVNICVDSMENGRIGIALSDNDSQLRMVLTYDKVIELQTLLGTRTIDLPADFDAGVFHLIRIERDGALASIMLDAIELATGLLTPAAQCTLSLFTDGLAGTFAGFALTEGFEERFEGQEADLTAWQFSETSPLPAIKDQELVCAHFESGSISRKVNYPDLEFAAVLRVLETTSESWSFGISLQNAGNELLGFHIESGRPRSYVDKEPEEDFPALENVFDWSQHHQLRIMLNGGVATLYIDDVLAGRSNLRYESDTVAVVWNGVSIAIDTIKCTRV